MLVTKDNYSAVKEIIAQSSYISLDTETTGLMPYSGDKIFAMSISTEGHDYYFDFRESVSSPNTLLFDGFSGVIFIHNAKFDAAFLLQIGIDIFKYKVHDTMAIGRVVKNDEISLSLDALGSNLGYKKSGAVKAYMDEHGLFSKDIKGSKLYHFDKVPIEVIQPYAEKDARITYQLGRYQMISIEQQDELMPSGKPLLRSVADNEIALTPVLFDMEKTGIKIDREYTKLAHLYETNNEKEAITAFEKLSGKPFVDSGKSLSAVFKEKYNISLELTDKGNPQADEDALTALNNPLADIVLAYRSAHKKISTYYGPFLELCDANGVIHCSFFQCGAQTGRFSCRTPNLQNLTKSDEDSKEVYQIRKCFVPREEYIFVMLDYVSMEYKLLLEYANEAELIKKILGGLDVHQATADMLGISRKHAKTVNFGLLYGCGALKLSYMLGCTKEKAERLRALYYERMPNVGKFISTVIETAKRRRFIFNWFGRRYNFNSEYSYKATNYLIQGGCADIIKKAMVEIHHFLRDKKSRMLVQVHDELLFEIHKSEIDIVPEIKAIMEGVYPSKYLPLTCSVEWSDISWQDKKEWDSQSMSELKLLAQAGSKEKV